MKLAIRTIRRPDGERLPLLVGPDGMPAFGATAYTISSLRKKNLAVSTITHHLRAIALFEFFCDTHGIDLGLRIDDGRLLTKPEVGELVRLCRLQAISLKEQLVPLRPRARGQSVSRSIEKYRKVQRADAPAMVTADTARARIDSIAEYLEWRVEERLGTRHLNRATRERATTALTKACKWLKGLSPRPTSTSEEEREGLPIEDVERILQVTHPNSPNNPWKHQHTRYRNALLIWWLTMLGLRRGELLGVQVRDVNFQKETVDIVRRPHNADDPRREQPLVKTRERHLALDPQLVRVTLEYVTAFRAQQGNARRHEFLLVASGTGAPLSLSAIDAIFRTLRQKIPGLSQSLTAHVLRHTWNDLFSAQTNLTRTNSELEERMRSYLMGWSEFSGSAARYTRRYTRKQGEQASLAFQQDLLQASLSGSETRSTSGGQGTAPAT